jgi:hypothetical protein
MSMRDCPSRPAESPEFGCGSAWPDGTAPGHARTPAHPTDADARNPPTGRAQFYIPRPLPNQVCACPVLGGSHAKASHRAGPNLCGPGRFAVRRLCGITAGSMEAAAAAPALRRLWLRVASPAAQLRREREVIRRGYCNPRMADTPPARPPSPTPSLYSSVPASAAPSDDGPSLRVTPGDLGSEARRPSARAQPIGPAFRLSLPA